MNTLACDQIEATKATQVRVKIQKDIVDAYREDLEDGVIFPPVVVFAEKGSERYILADGFHRLFAHVHAEIKDISVSIHEGGMQEALIFALGANSGHSLRRSNSDKINAVKLALNNPEIAQMTQQEIADICRVDRKTVNRIGRKKNLDGFEDEEQEGGEPEENNDGNVRPTKPEPTQAEIERDELRQAAKAIRAFPYGGDDTAKLELTPDDIADLEYVSTWCAHAVVAYRTGEGDPSYSGPQAVKVKPE